MHWRDFEGNNPIGKERFTDIIAKYVLKVRLKVQKPQTADSLHGLPTYPDIVKDFIPMKPDQLWVSDITYITVWIDGYHCVFCYLPLILYAFSEEFVG